MLCNKKIFININLEITWNKKIIIAVLLAFLNPNYIFFTKFHKLKSPFSKILSRIKMTIKLQNPFFPERFTFYQKGKIVKIRFTIQVHSNYK